MPVGTTLDLPRVIDPSWRPATILDIRSLADAAVEVALELAWPGHEAGQYLDVRFPGDDLWSRPHSFSIAPTTRLDAGDPAVIRIAARADVFDGVLVGDTVSVDGPKGDRMAWRPASTGERPLLLIGGGTGIVPLLSIARGWSTVARRGPLHIIHSVRTVARQVYANELAAIAALPDADVVTIVTGEASAPATAGRAGGRLSALDIELVGIPWHDEPECFVCGPVAFVESITRMLVEAKYPAVHIRTEWDVSVEQGDA